MSENRKKIPFELLQIIDGITYHNSNILKRCDKVRVKKHKTALNELINNLTEYTLNNL